MNTASTATLSQPEANATAFAQTSAMSAMDAMLDHRPGHLKMPLPDAYAGTTAQYVEHAICPMGIRASISNSRCDGSHVLSNRVARSMCSITFGVCCGRR